MIVRYRGLTWDHPRGYNALAAAAKLAPERHGIEIVWDGQPLEGFEAHPIDDLCARYDLVVLDHPHVGEAVEKGCLHNLEEIFGRSCIEQLEAVTIGPCLASYRYAGRHWALPLDAATQVMAARSDLIDGEAPKTWDAVRALSARTGQVVLSLAGPHAILTYFSIAAALGDLPATADPDRLVSPETGIAVIDLMAELASRSPAALAGANPIGILEYMTTHDDVALCPLVYGYVNYSAQGRPRRITFLDAPRCEPFGRLGSTLGGTGIGLSRRCSVSEALKTHLLWLMSEEVQTRFIPDHEGQPSRRSAWSDPVVNSAWGDFYFNTAATLEAAYVRPRHDGYIAFQTQASALLRRALEERRPAREIVAAIDDLYRHSRHAASER